MQQKEIKSLYAKVEKMKADLKNSEAAPQPKRLTEIEDELAVLAADRQALDEQKLDAETHLIALVDAQKKRESKFKKEMMSFEKEVAWIQTKIQREKERQSELKSREKAEREENARVEALEKRLERTFRLDSFEL